MFLSSIKKPKPSIKKSFEKNSIGDFETILFMIMICFLFISIYWYFVPPKIHHYTPTEIQEFEDSYEPEYRR